MYKYVYIFRPAILKLTASFHLGEFHGKVQLSAQRYHRTQVHMTGWGENSAGFVTENLQHLKVRSICPVRCESRYLGPQALHVAQYCLMPESPMAYITRVRTLFTHPLLSSSLEKKGQ